MQSIIIPVRIVLERESGDVEIDAEVEVTNDTCDFSNWGDSWPSEKYDMNILDVYSSDGERKIRLTEDEKELILEEAEEHYAKYHN